MNQKGFTNIVLVVVIVVLIGTAGYFAFRKKLVSPTNMPSSNQVVNNEIVNRPFISPSQKTIDSDKEIEFIFSAPKEAAQSKVYLSCESGLFVYFSDNLTPRSPAPSNRCNTWQDNRWDTIQPDPKFVRDIRDIKFRNDSTEGKVATLQMTVTMPDNSSIKSDLSSITVYSFPKVLSFKSCITSLYQDNRSQYDFWKAKFTSLHPEFRNIYDAGSYCELSDGTKLISFSHFSTTDPKSSGQTIALFDANRNLIRETKGLYCQGIGDVPTPFLDSVNSNTLFASCRVADEFGKLTVKKGRFEIDISTFHFRQIAP